MILQTIARRRPTRARRPHGRLAPAVAALLLLLASPASPDAVTDAADAVLRPGADCAALAARDEPDPWLVADELCGRGEFDAAEAFARAAPRPSTERLPEYVIAQRAAPTDPRTREVLRSVIEAMRRRDTKGALDLLQGATPGADVTGCRLLQERGVALRGSRDLEGSAAALRESAESALALGWLSQAALALHEAGVSHFARSDWNRALDACEERLRVAETWGNRSVVAATLGNVGILHMMLGDHAKALAIQERALAMNEELGDRAGIAATLTDIGLLRERRAEYPQALAVLERALSIHEEVGNRDAIATTLSMIGVVHSRIGEHWKALSCCERSLALREELGDRAGAALELGRIGSGHSALGDHLKALSYQQRSLQILEEEGNRAGTAVTLGNIGNIHNSLGNHKEALSFHERALKLREEIGDRAGVAHALGDIGTTLYLLDDLPRALSYQERALQWKEEQGNPREIAETLVNLGLVYLGLSDYPKALSCQERALRMNEETGNRAGVAAALGSLGKVYLSLGEYAKALSHHRRSLELMRELGDSAGVALTLGHIGQVHETLGEYDEAMSHLREALRLREELADRAGVAATLTVMGAVCLSIGDYPSALSHLRRSLEQSEAIGSRSGVVNSLADLGLVYRALGDYPKALSCEERALRVAEELGSRAGAAVILHNIGAIHWSMGDHPGALACVERALEILEPLGNRTGVAGALGSIGAVHGSLGNYAKALAYQERALKLFEELGNRRGIAQVLGNLGRTHGSLGDSTKALAHLNRSLKLLEELGDRFFVSGVLGFIGEVHASLGDYPKALEHFGRALEQARAVAAPELEVRWLWRAAAAHGAAGGAREAVSAGREAVDRMSLLVRGLSDELGATAREQYVGGFEAGIRASRDLGDIGALLFFLESGRAATLIEGLALRDRLGAVVLPDDLRTAETAARTRERMALTAYRRALDHGEEVDALWKEVEEARGGVLDAVGRIRREAKAQAGLLYPVADPPPALQGALGECEALVLYALLEKEALAVVVTRREIRTVALGATEKIVRAAESLRQAVQRPDERGMAAPPHETFAYLQKRLRALVLEPLRIGRSTTRLLVSPDGVLSHLPFSAFCEIEAAYVPSGTSYRLLKEEGEGRGEGVLALGDPDYSRPWDAGILAVLQRGEGLEPLPGSREEAKAIGDVVLLGREATVGGLTSALTQQPRWRAVHFACHGLMDPARPALSALALTPSEEHDGLLKCLDVYQMRIPADLVVLSACETAKGKVYRTEGVMGWTRAFMFAGAPRVIVSLWKVDDEATRALMEAFYAHWRTMPAATALKKAQEHVAAREKWKHPYFWAAWQLWGLPD